MRFAPAERVADAVLYEGYVLYPYRASAAKNQLRWQFGVLAPRAPRADACEPWCSQTECLVAARPAATLFVRVRFLQRQARTIETVDPSGARHPVPSFAVDGRELVAWDEGVTHAFDTEPIPVGPAAAADLEMPIAVRAGRDEAPVQNAGGRHRASVVRERRATKARLIVHQEPVGAYVKLTLRLENLEPWDTAFDEDRAAMLGRSLIAAHLLLAVEGGAFASLLEPPPDAAAAAAACRNEHTWPVLIGDRSSPSLMLSSPILLYDFPATAPESPGDLCDAAEIDEILSLRILTLTDEEKREARATDPRAAAIIDRTEALTPEAFGQLHGTMRGADFFNPPGTPAPEDASVTIESVRVARGSRVRLRPRRRADAMDMFLRDQAATVTGVHRDVDDRTYVAVTVDADPAAELHGAFGRFFYFDPDEIEPLGDAAGAAPAGTVDSEGI